MAIIGVDYHPSDQYVAFADTETREHGERVSVRQADRQLRGTEPV
jgi:hypothetical protein